VASLEEAKRLICVQAVDAVVVDQDDAAIWGEGCPLPEAIAQLLTIPGLKVIAVSLQCQMAQVYRHEMVSTASVEDFLAAVLA